MDKKGELGGSFVIVVMLKVGFTRLVRLLRPAENLANLSAASLRENEIINIWNVGVLG